MDAEAKEVYAAAMKQDSAAAYALAKRYRKGEGVKQDLQEALKWYEKAAEQGVAEAQLDLAIIYEGGQIAPRDYGLAMRWYLQAAMQGNSVAKLTVSDLFLTTPAYMESEELAKWEEEVINLAAENTKIAEVISLSGAAGVDYIESVLKGAELGSAHQQYMAGTIYSDPDINRIRKISQNKAHKEAFKWMKKSAEQNHPEAQHNLGYFYDAGLGTPKNHTEAAKWFGKSADQGFVIKSYLRLALMYWQGQGVKENNIVAYALVNFADAKGYESDENLKPAAKELKSRLALLLNSRQIEQAQALSTKMYDSGNITETIKQFLAGN